MVVHKLKYNGKGGFTECNKCITFTGGQGSTDWNDVDCKRCLKNENQKP